MDLNKINKTPSPQLAKNNDIPFKLGDNQGDNVEKVNLLPTSDLKKENSKSNIKLSKRSKNSSIRLQKLEAESRNNQLKPSNSHQTKKRKKILEVIDLDEDVSSQEDYIGKNY